MAPWGSHSFLTTNRARGAVQPAPTSTAQESSRPQPHPGLPHQRTSRAACLLARGAGTEVFSSFTEKRGKTEAKVVREKMLDKWVFPDFPSTFRIFILSTKYLLITYCLLGTEPGAGHRAGSKDALSIGQERQQMESCGVGCIGLIYSTNKKQRFN